MHDPPRARSFPNEEHGVLHNSQSKDSGAGTYIHAMLTANIATPSEVLDRAKKIKLFLMDVMAR